MKHLTCKNNTILNEKLTKNVINSKNVKLLKLIKSIFKNRNKTLTF